VKTEEREPFRGIRTWKDTEDNILRVRLHYSADDDKNPATEKGRLWVEAGKKNAPSLEWWNQEQEIMFDARQGARIYQAYEDSEAQLIDPFPIPEDWTKYFILDTHPRVPHAMLWVAMNPKHLPIASTGRAESTDSITSPFRKTKRSTPSSGTPRW
jgi:hypothetical protein